MKRVWNYVVTMWQPAGAFLLGTLLIATLFLFRLGSIVPGANHLETAVRSSTSSPQQIIDNPINAPYKTIRHLAYKYHKTVAAERLVSAAVAGLSVVVFYRLARKFTSKWAALLGTLLHASSSVLLNNGRLATPNVMLLLLLALVACGYSLRFSKHEGSTWLATTAIVGISLYTPGMLYFIVAGMAWQYLRVRLDRELPKPHILGTSVIMFLLLLAPLVYGFVQTPSLWREYLALPPHVPQLLDFLKNLAAVPYSLLVQAPVNPAYRLGRQPMLDIFTFTALVLGCYAMLKQRRLDRVIILAGILVLGCLFTAVSDNFENSLVILPVVFLLVAVGIGYLLEQWRVVFPLNPLARTLSIVVMSLAVLVSCNFQSRRYLVAWPNNHDVRAVFTQK